MKRSFLTALGISVLAYSAIVHADVRDFDLHNATGETLSEIHVSPHSQTTWGPDILPGVLEDGQSAHIHFSGVANTCVYDVQVADSDGGHHNLMNLNLCTITVVSLHEAGGTMTFTLD